VQLPGSCVSRIRSRARFPVRFHGLGLCARLTSSTVTRTLLIGGGKMGEALLGGWLAGGALLAPDVAVVEMYEPRRRELSEVFPDVRVAATLTEALTGSGLVDAVIAVKPHQVEEVCRALTGRTRKVLSIAAGITISQLEGWLTADRATPAAVIRSMPNTPALVGAGASAIAGGTSASADDIAWASTLLGAVGVVITVAEHALDAVTGLSGSGPAYIFLVAEAMIEAGVSVGLTRDASRTLATQTLFGAAKLLHESGELAEVLRANVTSPGGTTAAGLRVLEQHGVRAAFIDAVHAAAARATELGTR
jgi:pyrroline-5-carboxylate reductase